LEAIRREAEADGPKSSRAKVENEIRPRRPKNPRYPTLDDGSTSVRAIPTPFETNRRRH
jgi:hypothetical protein